MSFKKPPGIKVIDVRSGKIQAPKEIITFPNEFRHAFSYAQQTQWMVLAASVFDEVGFTTTIQVISADGTVLRVVKLRTGHAVDVAISPDAHNVAVSSYMPPEYMPPETGEATTLPAYDTWEPRVIVLGYEDGAYRTVASFERRITSDRINLVGHLEWSPDSATLLFAERGIVWLLEPESSTMRKVARGNFPTFAPDGQTIAVVDVNYDFIHILDSSTFEKIRSVKCPGLADPAHAWVGTNWLAIVVDRSYRHGPAGLLVKTLDQLAFLNIDSGDIVKTDIKPIGIDIVGAWISQDDLPEVAELELRVGDN
jgi:hypothetical protein